MEQTPTRSTSYNEKVETTARQAHQTVDRLADGAVSGVGHASDAMHRAVNSTADRATQAADWAADVPARAKRAKSALTESACESIRAHPLSTAFGALAVGYVLGRIGRHW
ncbi:MAG TPA: hypothetical protein VJQ49_05560 [Casimicrobiaceae bacterium]|nr:hypothetical protein [Casimicrobiaceae bacterium]